MKSNSDLLSKNHSMRWMAGIAAATATTAAVDGAIVRILIDCNEIRSAGFGGTDMFSSDFTGGGTTSNISVYTTGVYAGASIRQLQSGAGTLQGTNELGRAYFNTLFSSYYVAIGGVAGPPYGTITTGATPQSVTGWSAIRFSDPDFNGGALTHGWLNVTVANISPDHHLVTINEIMFDDASTSRPFSPTITPGQGFASPTAAEVASATIIGTADNCGPGGPVFIPVPEPSSIGLLALGGAGVLLRRQRKKQTA